MNKIGSEFNIYGTNIHIKPHIKDKETMNAHGFKKPNRAPSWLYVESITNSNASLWIEIWDDNISIELLDDDKLCPYTGTKRSVTSRFMKNKLKSLQSAGIISGYTYGMKVWRDIYDT